MPSFSQSTGLRVLFTYSTNTDSDVVLTFKECAFWWKRYTNIR